MATVRAVAKMGYEVVEFYAPYFMWTEAHAKDMRKLMDDLGIQCNSTHNRATNFDDGNLTKTIDLNQTIGSKYPIMASNPTVTTIDGWKRLGAHSARVRSSVRRGHLRASGRGSGGVD